MRRTDPDTRGGAPLLGLNGTIFKAHGSAREHAIMNAIGECAKALQHHLNDMIQSEVAKANALRWPAPKHDVSPPSKFKNPRARHNFQGRTCSIVAVGSYVPDRVLSNADLEKMVDTSDEWITHPHRHQGAPHRRQAPAHLRSRRQGRPRRHAARQSHRRRN